MRLGQIIRQYESVKVSRKIFVFFEHETVSWITKSFRIWRLVKTAVFIFQKYLHPHWKDFERLSRKNFRWVVCEPTIGSYNGRLQMKLTDWKPFQTLLGEPRLRTRIGTQKMTNLDFKKSFFYNFSKKFKSESNKFFTPESFLKFGIH